MYSINLSILSQTENYIPQNHIVNLKQLSDNVVRIQLAERTEEDRLPVVHSNSKKFEATHNDALTVDVTMSSESQNVIIRPKNFDGEMDEIKGFNLSDTFYNIVKLILKANDLEVNDGYKTI